jgi:Purple acid Phosphatase, N-terminal domain
MEAPEPVDSTAPVISGVSTQTTGKNGAVITWTTDEAATSQVEYGLTTACGSATAPDTNLVTSHTVILSGLKAGTTYNFVVKSKDATGNESVSPDQTLATSNTGTLVGGVIPAKTTWTERDSPYLIIDTIEVPAGVTLTIESGVSVLMSGSSDYMFMVRGTVLAHGYPGKLVTLDGGMHSFFSCENAGPEASVDLDYCAIKNGASLINFVRGFYLGHSEITNLTEISDISSGPTKDVNIEFNKFTNASGFITGGGAPVYIKYNYFYSRNRTVQDMPWVVNKAGPATVINHNFFLDKNGITLMLQGGSGTEAIMAPNNYWGTLSTIVIEKMIWDKNDDSSLSSYIQYSPIRTSPEPIRMLVF